MNTLVVTLNCAIRPVPTAQIEQILNGAKDWLRFSVDSYFIKTELGNEEWYRRIRAVLHPEDLVLVVDTVEGMRTGWVSQMAVAWFNNPIPALPFGQ